MCGHEPKFYKIHGMILFFSWGILADIGIFISAFFKNYKSAFKIHIYCFKLILIGTLFSEGIILYEVYFLFN